MNISAVLLLACARAAHEANRAYCCAIGDGSQKPWDDAEPWQRDSAIKGVRLALSGSTPEEQHAAWCKDKESTGWRHGPVKDAEAKTHPCLVPYADLPEEQRRKDGLYIAVVQGMAGALTEPGEGRSGEVFEGRVDAVFRSAFDIGYPCYVEVQGVRVQGHVRAVTFTTGKVRYAVRVAMDGDRPTECTTLHNLDSVLVTARDGERVFFDVDNYS